MIIIIHPLFRSHANLYCFITVIFICLLLIWEAKLNDSILIILPSIISLLLFLGLILVIQLLKKTKEELREKEKIEDELRRLSNTDALTRIPNRRLFQTHLSKVHHEAIQKHEPLSIALIDIDLFKKLNDTFGHTTGDQCLIDVARTIKDEIKYSNHFVARYGGEEFIMILPNTTNRKAIQIVEGIRKKIECISIAPFHTNESNKITISAGVATMVPSVTQNKDFLIELADQHLYKAKQHGRNKVIGN